MDELKKIEDIIAEHEARVVSVPSTAWYYRDPACVTIIGNARKRGFFYTGDVVKMVNLRRETLGFKGDFTSKSNPVVMAMYRGTIKTKQANHHVIKEADIDSVLEFLRGYKPRRRKERS